MDIRLPFKETRLATAHKVRDFATRIGHRKFAEAMEIGIGRIEKEMAPRECKECKEVAPEICKKCGKHKNTKQSSTRQNGRQGGIGAGQHSSSSSHSSSFVFDRTQEEVNPDGYFDQEEDALSNKSRKNNSSHPNPKSHAPKFSFKRGLFPYVRDMVEHTLQGEVNKRVQERMANNPPPTQQLQERERGRVRHRPGDRRHTPTEMPHPERLPFPTHREEGGWAIPIYDDDEPRE
jgi:hypothetical protein